MYSRINTSANSRVYSNNFTSFIDGSGLYGNTDTDANSMRAFKNGLLKSVIIENAGEFPPSGNGLFLYTVDNINLIPVIIAYFFF